MGYLINLSRQKLKNILGQFLWLGTPPADWEYPEEDGDDLIIRQAYNVTIDGDDIIIE